MKYKWYCMRYNLNPTDVNQVYFSIMCKAAKTDDKNFSCNKKLQAKRKQIPTWRAKIICLGRFCRSSVFFLKALERRIGIRYGKNQDSYAGC